MSSIASHKCTILKRALDGETVTAADFAISNCNQYLIELENDGYLQHIFTEPDTGKKHRKIADEVKALNFVSIFEPKAA